MMEGGRMEEREERLMKGKKEKKERWKKKR